MGLTLSDEERVGASKTFFTKVKEELQFIPAQLKVLEYWQEKAVFEQDGEERILAATHSVHPLSKCTATTSLLVYIITSKYAHGLPLYRLERTLKRLGHEISRTNIAHWLIRLDDVFRPLINLMRGVQNSGDYLQADGYLGYGKACRNNGIIRISLLGSRLTQVRGDHQSGKVAKGTLTRTAMDYTLNQWPTLVDYCKRGDLKISNVMAESVIHPFALGRKAWLFADTSQGARASATCYSLVETAKTNKLEPSVYIQHVLGRVAEADTLEKMKALLP